MGRPTGIRRPRRWNEPGGRARKLPVPHRYLLPASVAPAGTGLVEGRRAHPAAPRVYPIGGAVETESHIASVVFATFEQLVPRRRRPMERAGRPCGF